MTRICERLLTEVNGISVKNFVQFVELIRTCKDESTTFRFDDVLTILKDNRTSAR